LAALIQSTVKCPAIDALPPLPTKITLFLDFLVLINKSTVFFKNKLSSEKRLALISKK